ncbi:MAG TPA: DegV family protein, partial [Haloplasmataceae bacterium]
IKGVEDYISKMRTLFLLESLENLAKAGRLKSYVKIIASLLAIKPIMGSNRDGTIRLVHKVRGYKKAFNKFIETIGEESKDFSNLTLGIAYCNCLERALDLKNKILETYNFKDVYVVEMKGLSSTYADLGGIVIAF